MCLTIPGRIEALHGTDPVTRTAEVFFDGPRRTARLLYLPDAKVGDYVIVQAGFATTRVAASEALEAWRYIREMNEGSETTVARSASEQRPSPAPGA